MTSYFCDSFDAAQYTYRTNAKVRAFCESKGISVEDLAWFTENGSYLAPKILIHRR